MRIDANDAGNKPTVEWLPFTFPTLRCLPLSLSLSLSLSIFLSPYAISLSPRN